MTNKIDSKHPDYESINAHSKGGRYLMGGTLKMQEMAAEVLPKNQHETDVNYENRILRSVLLNVYKDTVDKLSQKPFQESVTWSEELPEKFNFMSDNIDGAGTTIDSFCETLIKHKLMYGKHIVMVNMPSLLLKDIPKFKDKVADDDNRKINPIDQSLLKLNPYASIIDPITFINWLFAEDKELAMMKVEYEVELLNGDSEVEKVKRIDHITRSKKDTYEKKKNQDGEEEWALINSNHNQLNEIALIIGSNLYDLPTLENLAELNTQHFCKSSDKDNNIHIAMTPFLLFLGFDAKDIEKVVSVHNGYNNDATNADIKWIEISGEGVKLAIDDLKELESKMMSYGTDTVTSGAVSKTATENKREDKDKMSILQSIVVDTENTMNKVLGFMAKWLGEVTPTATCQIFKDFNVEDTANSEMELLLKCENQDIITPETVMREGQARKLFKNKEFNIDDEVKAVKELQPDNFDFDIEVEDDEA